ncbi:uncharacterized protein N7473_004609 [Penicillium subrubescens]|uniref:uncharacterized protein n=1 Tax=Penicillium subrubescens TaxID=1316194 RepID=UPI002545681C|nr:uncharacterized protein N7473_004609 [Penicillium subrubescens]KAJ5900539.1 hypothetical protein N7473_004609 [Penicillium subrubescens]
MSGTNPLSPDNILELAAKALGSGQPILQTPYEALALIGHACMAAVDFRLVGLGEDHNLDSSTEPSALPTEWNANSTFAFRYAHAQSSMQYLFKVSRLGNNAVIFALALGDDRTSSFDLPAKDYISASALPLTQTENLTSDLRDVFISTARLNDLIGLFKINVIQKLAPGLYKEGYEEPSRPTREQPEDSRQRDRLRDDSLPQPARPYPFEDPLAPAPRQPNPAGDFAPPGFEDEFEINRPPRGFPQASPVAGVLITSETAISTLPVLGPMIHSAERWVRALVAVAGCIRPLTIPSLEALGAQVVVMILVHPLEHAMILRGHSDPHLAVAVGLVEVALEALEVDSAATSSRCAAAKHKNSY